LRFALDGHGATLCLAITPGAVDDGAQCRQSTIGRQVAAAAAAQQHRQQSTGEHALAKPAEPVATDALVLDAVGCAVDADPRIAHQALCGLQQLVEKAGCLHARSLQCVRNQAASCSQDETDGSATGPAAGSAFSPLRHAA